MHVKNFYITDDFRGEQRNLGSLADSIKRLGLLQPIIVEKDTDGFYMIKGGRRRFRALTEYLGYTELKRDVHYHVTDSTNLSDALMAQFEENYEREDFTPMELAALVTEIHKQKTAEHGKSIQGVGKGWGQKDTAKILGKDVSFVSRMLKISQNPEEVKSCKSVSEALSTLEKKRAKEIQQVAQKAKVEKSQGEISPEIERIIKGLKLDKAENFIKSLRDESIDFIYTDPPYGINLDDMTGHSYYDCYEDEPDEIKELIFSLIPDIYRVLKPDSFFVIWTSNQLENELRAKLRAQGFGTASTPLYWIKLNHPGKAMNPEKTFGSAVELAIYGWKGDAYMRNQGLQNAFPVPTVRKNRIHVAQKPEKLITQHLEIFSDPGQLVLDLFSGSGATLRACHETNRKFTGCESNEDNFYSSIDYTLDYFGLAEEE